MGNFAGARAYAHAHEEECNCERIPGRVWQGGVGATEGAGGKKKGKKGEEFGLKQGTALRQTQGSSVDGFKRS